jgi:hypothetical protein
VVEAKAVLNPNTKSEPYDQDMTRINTNKPLQGWKMREGTIRPM